MDIVLDTNTLVSDFHLKGAKFRTLFDHIKRSADNLAVPEVVFDETVNKFRQRLETSVRKMSDQAQAASELLGEKVEPPLSLREVEAKSVAYEKWLRERLTTAGAQFVPYPTTPHKDVVRRLMKGQKPFRESGAGYRDHLVWESYLDRAQKSEAAFVSQNTKDFANEDKTEFHQELNWDIHARGIKDTKYFNGLDDLIERHIKPQLSKEDALALQINLGKFPEFQLTTWLEDNLSTILQGRYCEEFFSEENEVTLESLNEILAAEVTEANRLDEDEVLLNVTTRFDANLEFFILKSDYYSSSDDESERIHILDGDWNEYVMQAGASEIAEAQLVLTLDVKTGKVTSTDVWEFRRVDPAE